MQSDLIRTLGRRIEQQNEQLDRTCHCFLYGRPIKVIKMRSPIPELGDIDNPERQRNLDRYLKNCVFVCHSSIDTDFIEKNIETFLDRSLTIATYTPDDGAWTYPYGIFCFDYARTKEMYTALVNTALKQCAAFVVVASENAAKSEWVRKEIRYSTTRFDQILVIHIDDMSFAQFREKLELPEAFAGPDQSFLKSRKRARAAMS